jgi:nucleoside-diphosphate-sugar epimerase
MILVTGGTGFIGSALVRNLVNQGFDIRLLIRPSKRSPRIPRSIPVQVAVSSLKDEKGLKAALKDVEVIYHLAGSESQGVNADLEGVDIKGTQALLEAAQSQKVKRFFFLSYLGAERSSAYPVLKAKGIMEGIIRKGKLPYTIFRTTIVYGPGDQFTTALAKMIRNFPVLVPMAGNGRVLVQPIWVEDLVTCMVMSLYNDAPGSHQIDLGGGEYLTYKQVVQQICKKMKSHKIMTPFSPPFLRSLSINLQQILHFSLIPVFLLDYLATEHICALDRMPLQFGLIPARFNQTIDYLIRK